MYTYIYLNQLDEARNLGYKLLENSQSQQILNGLVILEEKCGNYQKSIEFINKILEANPNNEFYKNKKQTLLNKGQTSALHKEYSRIATLGRSINRLIEQKENNLRLQGETANHEQILREVTHDVYTQIRDIAQSILKKHPSEVIAKEKLVKSLYKTGNLNLAKDIGEKFLKDIPNDELILTYMCKICRDTNDLISEKYYLEQIINNNPRNASTKNLMRLDKVNIILDRKKEKEKNMEITFTEENRKAWIEQLERNFKYGNISLSDIDEKIKQARFYPNYVKSLIALLDLKAMITEDYQGELEDLNNFLETEPSISKEEYRDILLAMDNIKKQYAYQKALDTFYDDNYER